MPHHFELSACLSVAQLSARAAVQDHLWACTSVLLVFLFTQESSCLSSSSNSNKVARLACGDTCQQQPMGQHQQPRPVAWWSGKHSSRDSSMLSVVAAAAALATQASQGKKKGSAAAAPAQQAMAAAAMLLHGSSLIATASLSRGKKKGLAAAAAAQQAMAAAATAAMLLHGSSLIATAALSRGKKKAWEQQHLDMLQAKLSCPVYRQCQVPKLSCPGP